LREKVPVFITIVVGILVILKFFLNVPQVKDVTDEIEQWCLILTAVAGILGVLNILRVNLRIVRRRGSDWQYKIVLIVSMLMMIIVGLVNIIRRGDVSIGSEFYYLFVNIVMPLGATMYALLAFYIASAAFRAFRARNVRAFLLLISGTLVMIGRVPLGAAISPIFPRLAEWLMTVPNAAGQRGLIIGAAMGVVVTGLRIIIGIERPYLKGN
jgi:hypothetical protein